MFYWLAGNALLAELKAANDRCQEYSYVTFKAIEHIHCFLTNEWNKIGMKKEHDDIPWSIDPKVFLAQLGTEINEYKKLGFQLIGQNENFFYSNNRISFSLVPHFCFKLKPFQSSYFISRSNTRS